MTQEHCLGEDVLVLYRSYHEVSATLEDALRQGEWERVQWGFQRRQELLEAIQQLESPDPEQRGQVLQWMEEVAEGDERVEEALKTHRDMVLNHLHRLQPRRSPRPRQDEPRALDQRG